MRKTMPPAVWPTHSGSLHGGEATEPALLDCGDSSGGTYGGQAGEVSESVEDPDGRYPVAGEGQEPDLSARSYARQGWMLTSYPPHSSTQVNALRGSGGRGRRPKGGQYNLRGGRMTTRGQRGKAIALKKWAKGEKRRIEEGRPKRQSRPDIGKKYRDRQRSK